MTTTTSEGADEEEGAERLGSSLPLLMEPPTSDCVDDPMDAGRGHITRSGREGKVHWD